MSEELEAYIEPEVAAAEEADEEEEDSITLADVEFSGQSLEEYEEEFSVNLPALPCSSTEMGNAIVKLNNAYQNAYNCYNKLLVFSSRAESQYKAEKYRLCNVYIETAKAAGVTKGKLPAISTIEAMVCNNPANKKLKKLMVTYKKYDAVKDWFHEHKTKLEKSMMVAKELIYLVTSSDRMNRYDGGRSHGVS